MASVMSEVVRAFDGPRWFGPERSPLLGWYHHAAPGDGPAVVLCTPLGYEVERVQRTFMHLAAALAGGGLPAFRFAYDGTGDSSGSDTEPGRVGAWLESIDAAIEEAKRISGRRTVALVAVRAGGILAMNVCARRTDVVSVVLVAPVESGRAFTREVTAMRGLAGGSRREDGEEESAGFRFTASTLSAMKGLDLVPRQGTLRARVLVVPRDDLPDATSRVIERLGERGVDGTVLLVPGYACMSAPGPNPDVPGEMIDRIVEWLGGVPGRASNAPLSAGPACAVFEERGVAPVYESPLFLAQPDGRRVFAIRTAPSSQAEARQAVLLLNTGAYGRVGPGRLYVTLARRWGARGITTYRVDLPGLGDTPPAPGEPAAALYTSSSLEHTREIVESLRRDHGVTRVVLGGMCSGAYLAHRVSGHPTVHGTVLLNPPPLYWREVAPERFFEQSMDYIRGLSGAARATEGRNWLRVLRREVPLTTVARYLLRRMRERVADPGGNADADRIALRRSLNAASSRGRRGLVVFDAADPGLASVERALGKPLAALREYAGHEAHVIAGGDHTFTPVASQEALLAILVDAVPRMLGRNDA